ncbi:MAG TPA: PilZ domain-containing protein [Planctomycetota bacterium]|nr:PilZ domain-containing protein [Planctomycetota bacterium]
MALISRSFDPERREFVRVRADLPVKYKFLSQDQTLVTDEVFDGTTSNISGAGILLVGQMPNSDWITGLLMERIVVGINLFLPGEAEPVKALTRTAWIEAIDERSQRCSMGLRFREITKDHLDRLFKFVIRAQMP